ncbi:sulfotransferase domain-containing protein [Mesoflavibacter zeaxanthinifaciens]|uniref:sulfotransferase domain-containing protein n=1 Tax=Mesoflavibacter zeaxanthinifaciens TaxID=393060 RepID=UPI00138ABF2D|nr:sulfotransferase domain-containing protein [Mesoflavibacter zeaxanthinifaciens]
MILGAQKSGTTALHDYIAQHPKIISPQKKELHFFDSCKTKNIKDYHLNFPYKKFSLKTSFESTPRYLYYPETAKKIKDYNSKLKFIIVLRDPIKRAYSAWNMYKQMIEQPSLKTFFIENEKQCPKEKLSTYFVKNEFPSFYDWINFEINLSEQEQKDIIEPSIVRRGYYKEQIENYFKYFNKNQFLFIDTSELLNNRNKVLNEVFNFLDLNPIDLNQLDLSEKHKREYSETIDEISKSLLKKHYSIKNKGLEHLINKKMSWTS